MHGGAAHDGHHAKTAVAEPAPARAHHRTMGFEVGTDERPLVASGPHGPLWKPTPPAAPGRSSHGTFAELTVAAELDALRAEKSGEPRTADVEPAATRAAVLTTAQATKQLSRKCQRLIKAKKSKLRKADRKRRTVCLERRRKLIAASVPPAPTAPSVPAAPSAPIEGPTPTSAPPATTPSTPPPTTPVATTPTEPPAKKYQAVGIEPTDSDPALWKLTRGVAVADIVNVELSNTDSQVHDLWIAPGNAAGQVTDESAKQKLIGYLEPGERKAVDIALKPGIYIFICSIPGHETMKVKFIVQAP